MTLYTHHFRLDGVNHCIVNDRKNHRGRGTALCGIDLTGSKRRPAERTDTTCDGCLDRHTAMADELEGATT